MKRSNRILTIGAVALASSILLLVGVVHASLTLTDTTVPLTQNFDTTLSSTTNTTYFSATVGLQSPIPAGTGGSSGFDGTKIAGTSTNGMNYNVDNTGSTTSGGIYNYGDPNNTNDRALGMLAAGSNTAAFGVQVVNNSGTTLTGFTLTFNEEQYRLANGGGVKNTDAFAYGTDFGTTATASNYLTSTALIANTAGDLVSRNDNGTPIGVVTIVENSQSVTVSGLNIPAGSSLFLRWTDNNDTGSDAGLAIDDFSLSVTPVPEPTTIFVGVLLVGVLGWNQRRRLGGLAGLLGNARAA